MHQLNSPARLMAMAVALGCGVDLLFHDKALGVSFPLFMGMVVGALFALGRLEGVRPVGRNVWLVAPLLFFSGMVFVRASLFVTLHNIAISLVLLGMVAYFYSAGRVDRLGLWGYVAVPLRSVFNALWGARPIVRSNIRAGAAGRRVVPAALPFVRGLLLALPVLGVFTCLLASADAIFARLLADLLQAMLLFNFKSLYDLAWTAIIVLSSAWVLLGLLAYALSRRTERDASREPGDFTPPLTIGFIEAATVLTLVDLLFVTFAWIQFNYLFGFAEFAARGAWDYRDYARRGFVELVIASLLAMALIWGLYHLAWRETPKQTLILKALSTLMVGLVLVFLASAWQRIFYWEQVEAYMFTQKRIYVRIFIAWLALTFGWLLVSLWTAPRRFAIGAFAALLGFLATLNLANPDDNVVRYNLAQYARTGVIDAEYLYVLSEDAVPAIVQAFEELPPERRGLLREHLRGRLQMMDRDGRWREWQAFHLSRSRAYALLAERRAELLSAAGR